MKHISVFVLLSALVLTSCAGKFLKPAVAWHKEMLSQPGQNLVVGKTETQFKPWAVGQYAKYVTKADKWQGVVEYAITAKEGNSYWLEIRYTGALWGYKFLVTLANGNNPASIDEFFRQSIEIPKAYYYKLDDGNNEWKYSEEKDGYAMVYTTMFLKNVVSIFALSKGYPDYGFQYIDTKPSGAQKVSGGSFESSLEIHYKVQVSKPEGLVDRDVSYYEHSAVPIFGTVLFDAFYNTVELIETRNDFTGSLFVPLPITPEK